jgi:hypothetical protein
MGLDFLLSLKIMARIPKWRGRSRCGSGRDEIRQRSLGGGDKNEGSGHPFSDELSSGLAMGGILNTNH